MGGMLVWWLVLGMAAIYGRAVQLQHHDTPASGPLCLLPDCVCTDSALYRSKNNDDISLSPGLLHVHCTCHRTQELKLGLESRNPGSLQPPPNTGYLQLENCQKVELHSRLINILGHLSNLTVRNVHSLILHPNMYEMRSEGRERGANLSHVHIEGIKRLQVKRFAFKDLVITDRFYMGEVRMKTIVSMAFTFHYVKEFSVFASNFDHISMFGIKIPRCREFNILGMTHFGNLAANAIKVRCDKFSLAYNWFVLMHNSSLEVEYGLCDIQGNTFETMAGQGFLGLQPLPPSLQSGPSEIAMSGLVFRENKFPSSPVLPFASLAMPSYGLLSDGTDYIDVEGNQFPCSCDSIGWLLAFGEYGLNSDRLAQVGATKGGGTASFLSAIYSTAGPCIECDHTQCESMDSTLQEYAAQVLSRGDQGVICGEEQVTDYSVNGILTQERGMEPQPWREETLSDSDRENEREKEEGKEEDNDGEERKVQHVVTVADRGEEEGDRKGGVTRGVSRGGGLVSYQAQSNTQPHTPICSSLVAIMVVCWLCL